MKIKYSKHCRPHAQGHIYIDKPGACTVSLVGAAAMTQEELDIYGEIFQTALQNMTKEQESKIINQPTRTLSTACDI